MTGSATSPEQGLLIVVEGVSRSGKSTLVQRLLSVLNVHIISEWNSHPQIKPLTDVLKSQRALSPASFSLVHLLDFDQRYHETILPALRRGDVVLCDRYLPTASARDRCRGVDLVPALASLYRTPDVCIYVEPDFDAIRVRFLADQCKYGHYGLGADMFVQAEDVDRFLAYQRQQHEHYLDILGDPSILKWSASVDPTAEGLLDELERLCPIRVFQPLRSTA